MQKTEAPVLLAEMTEAMTGVGYWRLEAATNALSWSPQVFRILGMDESEGTPTLERVLALYHPDDRATVAASLRAILEEGTPYAVTVRLIRPDGELRHVTAHGAAERDASGKIVAVFGTFADVTDVKRAELELAASEARYRRLIENATDMILVYDAEGRLQYASPSIESVLGYRPDELLGRKSSEIMHPDDVATAFDGFAKCFAQDRSTPTAPIEFRAIAKDGRQVWLEAHPTPRRDPISGQLLGYQDAVRDISARKAVELKLAGVETRYALLAGHSNDVIMESDLDGVLTYISPSLLAISGVDPQTLIGRRYSDLVHRGDAEHLEAVRLKVLAELISGPTQRSEYRTRHKDGRWLWFETTPLAIVDPVTGKATGILDVSRDITARKDLEAQLERKCAEAEAAAVAKSEFLANMSHELRTPLTAVVGFSDLLGEIEALPPVARRYADRIATAARSLLAVVNDILDFSKLEAGQLDLDAHVFAPVDFIRETIELVRGQAQAKGLRVSLRTAATVPGHVSADSTRLRQVLLNLLSNAIKFTAEGEIVVDVSHEPVDSLLRVSVTDTGAGIPDELTDRLFKRFSQVDGSISRRHGGTGLGLAICKNIVELMGGRIGVESAPGKGSTFWFTVRAPAAAAAAMSPGAPVDVADAEAQGLRLLIVDDVETNRQLLEAILAPFGHVISEADSGVEAVRLAADQPFDLILMDVQMPGMDGLAASREIRSACEKNRSTPILALTANVLPEQIGACLAAGMNDHIGKPIEVRALLQKLLEWGVARDADAPAASRRRR
jgi:PAS domain S-box-containing protein